jgi:CrcB protein
VSWLLVALGGGAGAAARFGVSQALAGRDGFPWATFAINAAGSLLLGVLMGAFPSAGEAWRVRALLAAGFCGGFTTFSAFSYETLVLFQRGSPATALAYASGSVMVGLVAAWAGLRMGTSLAL